MRTLRRASERGVAEHGWLHSRHTFSFGDYHDPRHMGFRNLRVINDDVVDPGQGFGTHGHRDMEIVSWVLDGELAHKDSLGTGSVIRPGELQRMTAGTGIRHSELNPSSDRPVRFLQIWILPERAGLTPSYAQETVPFDGHDGRFHLVAGPAGSGALVELHADATIRALRLAAGATADAALTPGRHSWFQIARGELLADDSPLAQGDGLAVSDESSIRLRAVSDSELLWFELP